MKRLVLILAFTVLSALPAIARQAPKGKDAYRKYTYCRSSDGLVQYEFNENYSYNDKWMIGRELYTTDPRLSPGLVSRPLSDLVIRETRMGLSSSIRPYEYGGDSIARPFVKLVVIKPAKGKETSFGDQPIKRLLVCDEEVETL